MNHTEFFSALKKGAILPVYLFHGDEEFVKESAYNTLIQTLVPENRDFNVTLLDTDSAREIMDACETLPFMGDRRVVVNRRSLKDNDGRALAEYLQNIPPDTVLLIYVRGKADAKTTIVKKIRDMGGEVLFDPLSESEIIKWIGARAKKAGLSLSHEAARYFLQLVGTDMLNVSNEMQKLVGACTSGEIDRELISDIVTRNMEYKLFSMFQAFADGNMAEGFSELYTILGIKPEEEAMSVAGYILSCFKNMLAVCDLITANEPRTVIMKRLNMRDFALRGIEKNLRRFSREKLLYAIARFSDITYLKVTGRSDARDALTDAISTVFAG